MKLLSSLAVGGHSNRDHKTFVIGGEDVLRALQSVIHIVLQLFLCQYRAVRKDWSHQYLPHIPLTVLDAVLRGIDSGHRLALLLWIARPSSLCQRVCVNNRSVEQVHIAVVVLEHHLLSLVLCLLPLSDWCQCLVTVDVLYVLQMLQLNPCHLLVVCLGGDLVVEVRLLKLSLADGVGTLLLLDGLLVRLVQLLLQRLIQMRLYHYTLVALKVGVC